jgi:hypothetical protein
MNVVSMRMARLQFRWARDYRDRLDLLPVVQRLRQASGPFLKSMARGLMGPFPVRFRKGARPAPGAVPG